MNDYCSQYLLNLNVQLMIVIGLMVHVHQKHVEWTFCYHPKTNWQDNPNNYYHDIKDNLNF